MLLHTGWVLQMLRQDRHEQQIWQAPISSYNEYNSIQ